MSRNDFIIAGCVGAVAFISAVALAQTSPTGSSAVNGTPLRTQSQSEDTAQLEKLIPAPADIEDAAIEVPESTQSDWAPDITYDDKAQDIVPSDAIQRDVRPKKVLSDAGEDVLGTNSWERANRDAAAQAQLLSRAGRRERPIDPLKRSDLTKLSRVMGALHALRVSCSGRDDQTYRSRMATLLDLEAPDNGALRDPLVDAFNSGFQAFGRGASACPADARAQEATLAKDGFALARAMSARYRPAAKIAAVLPPANQPRQVAH